MLYPVLVVMKGGTLHYAHRKKKKRGKVRHFCRRGKIGGVLPVAPLLEGERKIWPSLGKREREEIRKQSPRGGGKKDADSPPYPRNRTRLKEKIDRIIEGRNRGKNRTEIKGVHGGTTIQVSPRRKKRPSRTKKGEEPATPFQ